MKRKILLLIATGFALTMLQAQEMIVNGTFDSDEGWTVYNLDSNTPVEVDFAIDDGEGPAMGEGPYLEVYAEFDQYVNCLVWQTLTLEAGATYNLSGAFKDLTGGALTDFWSELFLSLEEPVDGVDYTPPNGGNTDDKLSFNTWSGCGPNVDGTYQDDACGSGGHTEYVAPGETGEMVTVYFGIKTGFYTEGTLLQMDVAIDNVSLIKSEGTGVSASKQVSLHYSLHPAFPNPFNPSTTLRFSLTEPSDIQLSILNINGGPVRHLIQKKLQPGTHTVHWDGCNNEGMQLPSGVYLCQFKSGAHSEIQRLLLMK